MADKEVVTPTEAAALLGVGRRRLKGLLDAGEVPSIRLGPRTVRVPVANLREWLKRKALARNPEAA